VTVARSSLPNGALAVALAVLVAALGACSVGSSDDDAADPSVQSAATTAPTPSETPTTERAELGAGVIDRFYEQQVEWSPCEAGFECATVQVPVDYADAGGTTLGLAVNRRDTGDSPLGALIVNPGGPGASGIDYAPQAAEQFGDSVLQSYDIVGFDPRGVATSDPVDCLDDTGVDELVASDPDPDTAAEVDRLEDLLTDFTAGCVDDAGQLLPHLSTTDVARDLDIIREVVGDDRLHYYGASYGTFIGAVYAELFPEQVGRMVLDGAVDPSLGIDEVNKQQAVGFETALRAYVAACVEKPTCPLGDDLKTGIAGIQGFLDDLDAEPVATGTDRELTESLGYYGLALPLYAPMYWSLLDQAMTQAFVGDGSTLLALADAYLQRTESGYASNNTEVISAVNCLDDPSDATVADIRKSIPVFERASPTFGAIFAWSPLTCAKWPVKPASPVPDIDGRGASPIVVVGTTRDPATPYRWAQAMAEQLASGKLLTREGDGHTGYGMGNTCIDSAVDAYLVEGTVPAAGTRC